MIGMMDRPTYVFNAPALAIGCLMMVLCLATEGSTVLILLAKFKPRVRALMRSKRRIEAHVVFFSAILILLMSHLLQIYIWSECLYRFGIMRNIHEAVIFAGSTYTTVGFMADNLPLQWQLLAVIMATTGLFAFAWSTSTLYSLSQQAYPAED